MCKSSSRRARCSPNFSSASITRSWCCKRKNYNFTFTNFHNSQPLSDLSNNQIPERFFQGESAVWRLASAKPVSIILNDSNSSPEEASALQIKGVNQNH